MRRGTTRRSCGTVRLRRPVPQLLRGRHRLPRATLHRLNPAPQLLRVRPAPQAFAVVAIRPPARVVSEEVHRVRRVDGAAPYSGVAFPKIRNLDKRPKPDPAGMLCLRSIAQHLHQPCSEKVAVIQHPNPQRAGIVRENPARPGMVLSAAHRQPLMQVRAVLRALARVYRGHVQAVRFCCKCHLSSPRLCRPTTASSRTVRDEAAPGPSCGALLVFVRVPRCPGREIVRRLEGVLPASIAEAVHQCRQWRNVWLLLLCFHFRSP